MATILEEINKVEGFEIELDLGFSITEFGSGYSKRFFSSNYINVSAVFSLNEDELELFNIWYTEILKMGVEEFEADLYLGFGTQTYTFIQEPVITHVGGEMYNVSCLFLQKKYEADIDCITLLSCQNSISGNLKSRDTSLEASVEASEELKKLYLCSVNLTEMATGDLNTYRPKFNI